MVFCPLKSKECDDMYGPVSLNSKLVLSLVWHVERNRTAEYRCGVLLAQEGRARAPTAPRVCCRERSQPPGLMAGTPGSPACPRGGPRPLLLRMRCTAQQQLAPWELVRNAGSQGPPQTFRTRLRILNRITIDLCAH